MPERTCIVSREAKDEADLIRFVRGPDGAVVPDIQRKLPGRGVWVSLSREKVAQAAKANLFSRGFKAEARAAGDLAGLVAQLLRKAALAYLSLAKKAGGAVTGFAKVEEMLGKGKASVLVHAAEASADQCRKLDKLVEPGGAVVSLFRGDELDLAFGRSNVVHAALVRGRLAETFLGAVRRFERYETPLSIERA